MSLDDCSYQQNLKPMPHLEGPVLFKSWIKGTTGHSNIEILLVFTQSIHIQSSGLVLVRKRAWMWKRDIERSLCQGTHGWWLALHKYFLSSTYVTILHTMLLTEPINHCLGWCWQHQTAVLPCKMITYRSSVNRELQTTIEKCYIFQGFNPLYKTHPSIIWISSPDDTYFCWKLLVYITILYNGMDHIFSQ